MPRYEIQESIDEVILKDAEKNEKKKIFKVEDLKGADGFVCSSTECKKCAS